MTQVRNISDTTQDFTVGADANGAVIKSVEPRKTETVNLPEDHPQISGRVHVGVIEVVRTASHATAAKKAD